MTSAHPGCHSHRRHLVRIGHKIRLLGVKTMEEEWLVDRAKLRQLLQAHREWSIQQYARAVGRSRKWVQKWKHRLKDTDPQDQAVLLSHSRARKNRPAPYHPEVIARILELRDNPPEQMARKLGAPTLRYFLHQDERLKAAGYRLPSSTSTIAKILNRYQRIHRPAAREHLPFERPPAMDTWEIDFSDVTTAQARHAEKQQHAVEAFAVVDRGSSILVDLQSADDYHTETSIVAIASAFIAHGLPRCLVLDRDPRFVGSWSSEEFPSAFMRFVLNLGVALDICPPQRPDLKPFVERYFRTLKSECIRVKLPATLAQTQAVFAEHRDFYNHSRPNQSKACDNRPPYVAFPTLPVLPHLPIHVDPDAWLPSYHNHLFRRRVMRSGRIQIDNVPYYISRTFAGRHVVCKLDAHRRVFDVLLDNKLVKVLPIRGLYGELLEFGLYLDLYSQGGSGRAAPT